jgi:hypothetical protein
MTLSPDSIALCQDCGVEAHAKERASMEEVAIIGVDLTKNKFQPRHWQRTT